MYISSVIVQTDRSFRLCVALSFLIFHNNRVDRSLFSVCALHYLSFNFIIFKKKIQQIPWKNTHSIKNIKL